MDDGVVDSDGRPRIGGMGEGGGEMDCALAPCIVGARERDQRARATTGWARWRARRRGCVLRIRAVLASSESAGCGFRRRAVWLMNSLARRVVALCNTPGHCRRPAARDPSARRRHRHRVAPSRRVVESSICSRVCRAHPHSFDSTAPLSVSHVRRRIALRRGRFARLWCVRLSVGTV